MISKRVETNYLPMAKRKSTFLEVDLGYTYEQAIQEASRCLDCKNPSCMKMCPVNINIPKFIRELKNQNLSKSYETLSKSTSLASICGRVCPQEKQCQSACVLGKKGDSVSIGRLERFVADNAKVKIDKNLPKKKYNVAMIGSGPSSLACAYDLVTNGYNVTIYEALHKAGGVLSYGIPEFRLPKQLVEKEITKLTDLGVKIENNVVIGRTLNIVDLQKTAQAIFIGTGAGLPKFLNIPGEELNNVYCANEFLTRVNLMKAYQKDSLTPIHAKGKIVSVVGGGNVAIDAARTAIRLGAKKVNLIYRRSLAELPARKEEIDHAIEEGLNLKLLTNPVEILKDDNFSVKQIKCVAMELGELDKSNRRSVTVKKDSMHTIDTDVLIIAIGTSPNPIIKQTTENLAVTPKGTIIVDENQMTSIKGIFSGGDSVTGAATVISAMKAGKNAAKGIIDYLENNNC